MDVGIHELSHWHSISLQNAEENSGTIHRAEAHEMSCMVCGRTFIPHIGVNGSLDSLNICRDCKCLVMDDNDSSTTRNCLRNRRRRTSMYGSSESVENVLSQQFSQLIGLVRQNCDLQLDDDVTISSHQRHSSVRNWPRRVRRSRSETDNESIDIMDSLFGETDSHISFGGCGGDSDASNDGHSILDMETPSPLDYESRIYTDTDIDPMNAGLGQWISDDPSEYGDWDDVSTRNASIQPMEPNQHMDSISPNGSATSPQILWRVRHIDLFTNPDEIDLSPFTGHSGDYMDAQGFEELLEQLAEVDSLRIGAPPAAVSSLQNLPCVIVSMDHEKNGPLICAVCKDPLSIDSEAKQLPCSHLYHPSCIFPWLRMRNSCPVCRYELPTNDPEYEKEKQNGARNEIRHQEAVDDSYSVGSSDLGDETNEHDDINAIDDVAGGLDHCGNGRWLLIAAAPIVAIVGIAVAALVRNYLAGERIRIHHCVRDRGVQSQISPENRSRSRSWWSLY